MYANGTVNLTSAKNIPVGESMLELDSNGKSFVDSFLEVRDERLKYWIIRGDFGQDANGFEGKDGVDGAVVVVWCFRGVGVVIGFMHKT